MAFTRKVETTVGTRPTCPKCKGKGSIQLLHSVVPCDCRGPAPLTATFLAVVYTKGPGVIAWDAVGLRGLTGDIRFPGDAKSRDLVAALRGMIVALENDPF